MKVMYRFHDSSDSTILPEDCYESDVPILRFFRFYDFLQRMKGRGIFVVFMYSYKVDHFHTVPIKGHGIMIYFWTSHSPLWTGDHHLKLVIATLNWRSPLWTGGSPLWTGDSPLWIGDRHFELAIATLNWRLATLNWRSPLTTGDRHFELAIATLAIASFKWRSLVQSGDNEFQVVIASSKWRIASSKIYHYTMALNGHRTFMTILR